MGDLTSKETFVYRVAEAKWTKVTNMITGRYRHREDGIPHILRSSEITQLNMFCQCNFIYIHSKATKLNR
jgi:hypothetical protein